MTERTMVTMEAAKGKDWLNRLFVRKGKWQESLMPITRYILMDNSTGRIWGDTADLDGPARDESPAQAARRLDLIMGDDSRLYIEESPDTALTGVAGYIVYAAPEEFPAVQDGEDQAVIDAVIAQCEPVAFVEVQDRDEPETLPSP